MRGLAKGVRFEHDPVRGADALLYPEGALLLDEVAADILRATDVSELDYDDIDLAEVDAFLDDLADRRLLGGNAVRPEDCAGVSSLDSPKPIGMLAELTYRCPLHCTYCSNPLNLAEYTDELATDDWRRVLDEARQLGVLQVHFSGGEPLLRPDLGALVAHARGLGMYTNLITSGIPLTPARLDGLHGLDHIQLSIQDSDVRAADAMAGLRAHHRKLDSARLIDLPLTINVVLHAGNVDRLRPIAELAAGLGADRLELAHTQYYGWGLRNRTALQPTREQVDRADAAAAEVHREFGAAMEIVYVRPDLHTGRPKPCMNGWASRQFVVTPTGTVLPCLAAAQLPDLGPETVRRRSLHFIWYASAGFNRFRGTDWLPEPCHSCALREVDFGGCRCQAYQLTGDAGATDPACDLSPHHDLVAVGARSPAVPRRNR